jgi:hypothetical protein
VPWSGLIELVEVDKRDQAHVGCLGPRWQHGAGWTSIGRRSIRPAGRRC